MATVGRTQYSIDGTSESEGESEVAVSNNAKQIRDSIDRLQSWIAFYTKSQSGLSLSPNDVSERIERRLLSRSTGEECTPHAMDETVRNIVRLLVYQDRRSESRRAQMFSSDDKIESLQDPDSLKFADQIELESQIRFIRERIPADLIPIVDCIYGFADGETMTVDDLARSLGIRRNTLDQRLHRLFAKLRSELRKQS